MPVLQANTLLTMILIITKKKLFNQDKQEKMHHTCSKVQRITKKPT